jgi:alanine dehydrogenase
MPVWLSESDVHHALSMGELIDAMQSALAAFSTGKVIQPVRSVLEFHPKDFFALMPACDPEANLMGAKLVTVVPDNASRGLPSHQAIIALFDATTGEALAVTDGRRLGAAPRTRRRPHAGHHRNRRAGPQPPRRIDAGP